MPRLIRVQALAIQDLAEGTVAIGVELVVAHSPVGSKDFAILGLAVAVEIERPDVLVLRAYDRLGDGRKPRFARTTEQANP